MSDLYNGGTTWSATVKSKRAGTRGYTYLNFGPYPNVGHAGQALIRELNREGQAGHKIIQGYVTPR